MSIEEIIVELKRLTPGQVDEVARVIHQFSSAEVAQTFRHTDVAAKVPPQMVADAVRNGWPEQLFTEVIGSLPDLGRPTQPPAEARTGL